MRPIDTRVKFLATLILLSCVSTSAYAAGFSIFEQGAKATGMGGAFAATADDPSAIFYNVAGIAYQREMKAMVGGTVITFQNEFRGSNDNPLTSGYRGNYADHTFVPPNTYAIVPIGQNMTFGVGVFGAFGLRTDWEGGQTFPGRYISRDANLKTASVEPAFAWQMAGGKVALGVGAEYRRSHITLERNTPPTLNPFTGRIIDTASARLDSDWVDAWGYNVGVIVKPTDTLSFGLNYRSDMDMDYTGTAEFTQIPSGIPPLDAVIKSRIPPNQDIATTISYPAIISFGVATTAIPTWTVEFDVVRMTWSNFEKLDIDFANAQTPDLHIEENWDDVNSYRLGANHNVTDNWQIQLGILYDETPQPLSGAGPLLPDADRVGPSFGFGYQGEHWSFDIAEFFLVFMDRDTGNSNDNGFNGTYKTSANLLSANFGYRF